MRFRLPAALAGLLALSACDSAQTIDPPDDDARALTPLAGAQLRQNRLQLHLGPDGSNCYGLSGGQLREQCWWVVDGANVAATIYEGGLWVAGEQGGEVRASVASSDYGDRSNLEARLDDQTLGIFHVTADSLDAEITNWPVALGAPVGPGGAPTLYGDEMLWGSFQAQTSPQVPAVLQRPIQGLRVNAAVFAYRRNDLADYAFLRYAITNTSSQPITNAYVGFYSDTDLSFDRPGGTGFDYDVHSSNNLVGYDQALQLSYTYAEPYLTQPSGTAGVTGYAVLEAPHASRYHRMIFKGSGGVPVWGQQLITAPEHVWLALQGLSPAGESMVDPVTGQTTTLAYTGDPVAGTGWVYGAERGSAGDGHDARSLLSAGPFTLGAGQSTTFTVVWAFAQSPTSFPLALQALRNGINTVRANPALWQF